MLSCGAYVRTTHFYRWFLFFFCCSVPCFRRPFALLSPARPPPCAHGTHVCVTVAGVWQCCVRVSGCCEARACGLASCSPFLVLALVYFACGCAPSLLISLNRSIYVCVCTCTCTCTCTCVRMLLYVCVLSVSFVGKGFPPLSLSPPSWCLCVHVRVSCWLHRCRESLPWKYPPRGLSHERGACVCVRV